MKFEGEYLNGKRNGKGKEYDLNSGEVLFEGEYYNNRQLIGKEYDKNGNLICEINNIEGKGKEFYGIGELMFEGEYSNGERNGKGKEYYYGNRLLFEGEYLNGKRNGKGKLYNIFGQIIFEGKYLNDKQWEGIGYDPFNNIMYELKE